MYIDKPSKKSPIAINGFVNGPRPNDMPYPKSQYVTLTIDRSIIKNIYMKMFVCV